MTLGLTAQDVAILEGRTEGWIAAIQLAGLSMQGRDDIAGFISALRRRRPVHRRLPRRRGPRAQPEQVRTFLLETSILGRLNGPLSDAVTGREGGKAMLEALERENLLLVPLDDRREWYRYHHLFADVLQARLRDERPERVPELHRRATEWYEQQGEPAEAIRHAMAGGDFARAADLVELAMPATTRDRQEATLRRLAGGAPRRADPAQARAEQRVRRVDPGEGRDSRASRPACRMPSAGSTRPGLRARGRRHGDPGWSSWTRMRSARYRPGSPSTGPARPVCSAMSPARSPMPAGRSTSSARTTSAVGRRRRSSASPIGRTRISRRRAVVCRCHTEIGEGRVLVRRDRAAPSPWPTCGSRRAVSTMRCGHTSEALSSRPVRARRPAGSGGHARGDERDPSRAR